jgi:hypothetical protein
MSPKEKAEELVNKMYVNQWRSNIMEYKTAKQCALIAQQNLLQKLKELNIKDSFEEQVLLEINVL